MGAAFLAWLKATILVVPAVPSDLICLRDRLLGVDKLITKACELIYLTGLRDGAIYLGLLESLIGVAFLLWSRQKGTNAR